jgi:hypothetical protein
VVDAPNCGNDNLHVIPSVAVVSRRVLRVDREECCLERKLRVGAYFIAVALQVELYLGEALLDRVEEVRICRQIHQLRFVDALDQRPHLRVLVDACVVQHDNAVLGGELVDVGQHARLEHEQELLHVHTR